MKTDSDLLYYDFQGWPVYKANLHEILEALVEAKVVEKLQNQGVDKYIIRADSPYLNIYPEIMRDDGMGYSPNIGYISEVDVHDNNLRFWTDSKIS